MKVRITFQNRHRQSGNIATVFITVIRSHDPKCDLHQDIRTACTSIHRQFVSPVMAVPSASSSTALKKLEEQLTCGICLDLKTLPCLHSFCHLCLEGLPLDSEGDTYFISCPTCCHHTTFLNQQEYLIFLQLSKLTTSKRSTI